LSVSTDKHDYLELPLESFIELVSAAEPAPGGGTVAAAAVTMAAALCVMAARFSTRQMPRAPELAARAERLRDRAAPLLQADADAYGRVIGAVRDRSLEEPRRRKAIDDALSLASDVPLEVAEIAAAVAGVAAELAEEGNPNLLGDALAALHLAEGAARAAAGMVRVNLEKRQADDRLARAAAAVATASRHRRRAGGSSQEEPGPTTGG
jgi:methenyltetrahydrofolate cyclohydrolase